MKRQRTALPESGRRLDALKRLLSQGRASTQDELREALESQEFVVTQSTISRDLRRLGAIKAMTTAGQTIYRLATDTLTAINSINQGANQTPQTFREMVLDIKTNGATIVIITVQDAAPLISRHLDLVKPAGVLGTLAGDDTIFVAPAELNKIQDTIGAIRDALQLSQ